MVTWVYYCLIKIIISLFSYICLLDNIVNYMKPCNYVQIMCINKITWHNETVWKKAV